MSLYWTDITFSFVNYCKLKASNIPDDQPGPSGLCGLTSTGSDQPSPTGSNSVRQSFTSPAARVPQLSEDHCLVVSSSSDGEEESQSEEEMDACPRKPSASKFGKDLEILFSSNYSK